MIRPVTVTSSANNAALKSSGLSVGEIYKAVSPSVVKIVSTVTSSSQDQGFGAPSQGTEQAQGTGFMLDSKGNIVTNDHVVAQASKIQVITETGNVHRDARGRRSHHRRGRDPHQRAGERASPGHVR